jgi:transcription termination factor Rho
MRLERDNKAKRTSPAVSSRHHCPPSARGQRALLVAPPKRQTVMIQHIAHAISANYPDNHMMVLLIDERPGVTEVSVPSAG